jgi:hypothetical protein
VNVTSRNPLDNKTEGPKSQKGPEGFEGNGPITRSIPSIHPPKYNVLKIQYNPKTVDDTEREKYSTTQRQSMIQKGKRAKVWCGVEPRWKIANHSAHNQHNHEKPGLEI